MLLARAHDDIISLRHIVLLFRTYFPVFFIRTLVMMVMAKVFRAV